MAEKTSYRIKSRDKMKTVDVIFVSDDLVGEVITSRKDYERQLQRKLKEELKELGEDVPSTPRGRKRKGAAEEAAAVVTPKKSKLDDVELALAALENEEVEKESIRQPSTLFDEDGDISAGKMYTFQAKKTYSRSPLAKAAATNAVPVTPKANPLEKIEEEPAQPTPYSLRKRVISDIKKIQKILENSDDERDFSPSGSEYSGESSEEEEEDEPEERSEQSNSEEKKAKRAHNSGRSLSSLATPRLTREAVDNIFKELTIGEAHKSHVEQLFRCQLALFDKWDFLLRQNYNILLYGVGSKKDVVDKFLARHAKHSPVIKVNGFFPSVTVKDVLDQVCECLKLDSSGPSVLDRIESKLKEYDVRIYIGINNIDGVMIRSKKNQQMIARLARLPQIRLVASSDHINAPLLWDQCLLTDLNWVWMDATTFLPYTEETSYEGSILLHPSGQLTLASLRSVFSSLTRNARALFLILCRAQADAEKGWEGMAFRELYHEGRRQMLVSTDSALRLQLKEFIDHAIIKQKRSPEGEERFLIVMDTSILKQFLEEQEAS